MGNKEKIKLNVKIYCDGMSYEHTIVHSEDLKTLESVCSALVAKAHRVTQANSPNEIAF